MRSLTVYISGLFGPDVAIHSDDFPNLPSLNWMLSKGNYQTLNSSSASYDLCELFGLTAKEENVLAKPISLYGKWRQTWRAKHIPIFKIIDWIAIVTLVFFSGIFAWGFGYFLARLFVLGKP